jgi:hypothetical protein
VRDVGCGARSTDPAPSFCNSHFAICNCMASAHAEIDPRWTETARTEIRCLRTRGDRPWAIFECRMSSAEWLPGAEWGSHFPVGVTSQPRRVPITRFHLCRRNLGQFTSGIYVRVLGGVFRSQSRVRDVGCGARSIDRAPSFCNSHFAIRNCIASAHTGIDPCDCKLPIVKWQMVFGAEWRSHFPVGVTFQPCRVPITLLHLCRRAWRCRRFVSRAS